MTFNGLPLTSDLHLKVSALPVLTSVDRDLPR